MVSDELERMPTRRVLKASLPIVGDKTDDTATSSATPAAGDPDADLETMTADQLRQVIDAMKASRRRRTADPVRWLKAIGLLHERQGVARPPEPRPVPVSAPPAVVKRRAARAPRRVRLVTVLDQVTEQGGPKPVEDLARWLADDLGDLGSIRTFRAIADGVRSGRVDPQVVRAAYRAAKKPGVERPGALFTWFVLGRSPGLARERARRW